MTSHVDAYIGLGSNLDDPLQHIQSAVKALKHLPDSQFIDHSHLYHSAAIGPGQQPDYINAAVHIHTTLSPLTLLHHLQRIEHTQGRTRGQQRWLPRTLDLDLLLYGEQRINETVLTVPHPRIAERAFVLLPLSDLKADLTIPGKGTLSDCLEAIDVSDTTMQPT